MAFIEELAMVTAIIRFTFFTAQPFGDTTAIKLAARTAE